MDFFNSIHCQLSQIKGSVAIKHDILTEGLPMHQHPFDQFILVTKGLAYLITETRSYYIPAQHYIWIPRHISHYVSFLQGDLHIKTIYYSMASKQIFYSEIGIYPLTHLLRTMLDFTESWNAVYGNSWQQRFLISIRDIMLQENPRAMPLSLPVSNHPQIIKMIEYHKQHIDEDVTVPTIAQFLGFSVRSFSRFFVREMGITYVEYLKIFKILKAIELMVKGNFSVSEICYQVGYSSLTNFSNNFYNLLGVRPKAFLMDHQKSAKKV